MYFPLILIFFFSYIVLYSDLECIFVAGNAGYVPHCRHCKASKGNV